VEELVKKLSEKTGIDRGTAEKICGALQSKMANVQNLLGGDSKGMMQMLQEHGIDEAKAQKVLAFLKENAAKIPAWLEGEGGGVLKKAKEVLSGMMGRKEG
jgi:hypothetical protein